jgi:hypothetical protein
MRAIFTLTPKMFIFKIYIKHIILFQKGTAMGFLFVVALLLTNAGFLAYYRLTGNTENETIKTKYLEKEEAGRIEYRATLGDVESQYYIGLRY